MRDKEGPRHCNWRGGHYVIGGLECNLGVAWTGQSFTKLSRSQSTSDKVRLLDEAIERNKLNYAQIGLRTVPGA